MASGAGRDDFQRYLPGSLVHWSKLANLELKKPSREVFSGALLLTDISGFTRLTARLSENDRGEGAEQVGKLLNSFLSDLARQVELHEGSVLSFGGDSLLAGWAAPSSAGLKATASSACFCAGRIRAELRGPPLEEDFLHLRFAVGAGEITLLHLLPHADQRWLIVSGDCLSQVAHCGQITDTGEIVVSDRVWELIRDHAKGRTGRGGTARLESIEPYSDDTRTLPPRGAVDVASLSVYLPATLRSRLLSPLSPWLADLRTVTAMFVHLNQPDIDADLDKLNGLLGESISSVVRSGGAVLDSVMLANGLETFAVFGLPGEQHSDNARRAIISALRLSDRLATLGPRPSIGIATGETFCGTLGAPHRANYSVVGEAINTAARLASVAAGRILVDNDTAEDAAEHIDFDGPWFLSVPGMRGKVPAFVPTAAKDSIPVSKPAKLVGRTTALETLLRHLGEKDTVLVVKGEPGVGKSALLREFVGRTGNGGIKTLVGGADDIERGTPYFAWRNIIRGLLGSLEGLDPEEDHRASAFFRRKPHLAVWAPLLNDAIDLSLPENSRTQALSGEGRTRNLKRLIHEMVTDAFAGKPGIIVIEDVQWLDEASGLLLGSLLASGSVQVAVSTRAETTEADLNRWSAPHSLTFERIDLGPLDFDDTATLVQRSLGTEASEQLDELIYAQSSGNPFLIGEICRMISERGSAGSIQQSTLSRRSGVPGDAALVAAAKVTVLSRTDFLPADRQVILKLASAIGTTFTPSDLSELEPVKSAQVDVAECLDHLRRAELITTDNSRPDGYAFSHAIIKTAVYESMLDEQRRQAHAAIATAMEESGRSTDAENLPLVLSHWERAGNLPMAHVYLDRVAELRLRQFDNAAVVDLVTRFFRVADEAKIEVTPARRAAAWFMLGEANLNLGRAAAARNAYEEGLRLSGVPLPVSQAGLVYHLVLDVTEHAWRRLTHKNSDWIFERESAPSPMDPQLLAIKAHEDLTRIYYFTSEKLRLIHATLRATNLSERNSYVAPNTAINYASLGAICGVIPLRRHAVHYNRLAAKASERFDHPGIQARVHLLAGLYETSVGHWREARQNFAAGLERASAQGDARRWSELAVSMETISGPWLLTPAFEGIGKWDRLVGDICKEGRARGDIQVLGCGLLGGIRGYLAAGQPDRADTLLMEFADILAHQSDGLELVHLVEGASFLAEAARKRGQSEEALSWLIRAQGSASELNPAMKSRTLPALIRLFFVALDVAGNDTSIAKSALSKLKRFARVFPIGRPAAFACEAILQDRAAQTSRAIRLAARAYESAIALEMPGQADEVIIHFPKLARMRDQLDNLLANAEAPWNEVLRQIPQASQS